MKRTVQWRRNLGTYRAGQMIELPEITARALMLAGLVSEPPPVAPPEEQEPPKRRYKRRDLTAEGE